MTGSRGLVHLYTGDGKGKTTAALGLALRASGQGWRVCMLQFMKGSKRCGEHKFLERWPAFEIIQPSPSSFFAQSGEERLAVARQALQQAFSLRDSNRYDLLILDEALTALRAGLLSEQEVLDLIASKPEHLELALTGRGAPPGLIEAADLVTEMLSIKHPFVKGVRARRGIEY
ncbi:MAG: cob(I)yrinic acid a,c-diamide adenosyltransferase [Dehalococcoidia bacterium]|nr:cob(I)yrinic acid a,c-diamide adenosyltransferase [Dehalococcoidia bacterium]